MTELRKSLPPLPPRMLTLKVDDRGYPVPWFVKWINGKPDFRVIDPEKMYTAIAFHRCWVCGVPLGTRFAFVAGSLAAVNRASAEPPSHVECAEFSVKACPFMLLPKAQRRDHNMPEGSKPLPGNALDRNPGVACLWITKSYTRFKAAGGRLFRMGDPIEVRWFAEGRPATREEVAASIESGLPQLREIAEGEGEESMKALQKMVEVSMRHLPGVPEPSIDQPTT